MLTEYFAYYDQKAIEASSMYRSSIYFRSILPMIATIIIATGFYAETLLTFLLGEYKLLFGLNCWVVLAGVSFLIHALLNRYAGQIAKNPRVEQFRKDFVEARFIAEYLRVAIHSETYSIPVSNVPAKDSLVDKRVLAKNAHDVWARERMNQGWTYGNTRNDTKKEHPCLVPYEELPESEKDYDRNTAMETLKVILSMGYEIRKG